MNRLSTERRALVIRALVEGNSIRSSCRMTGTAKGTVLRLLADVGAACSAYQDKTLRNLPCQRVQVDEIWSFIGAKEKNTPRELRGTAERGDVWTWTAICADTKLVPSWYVGVRDAEAAHTFITDLESRLASRVQLTSDGLVMYLTAVERAFGWNGVDYAMLQKHYANVPSAGRYSPPECVGAEKKEIMGEP